MIILADSHDVSLVKNIVVVTDAPHTMKPEVEACVSWANSLRKMTLTRSTPHTCTSITRLWTEPSLIAEDKRAPFHSPVDSFKTPE